jgi:3-dehydroquinate dehydratase
MACSPRSTPPSNGWALASPRFYGGPTLADVEELCRADAGKLGLDIEFHQSNYEGQLDPRAGSAGQVGGIDWCGLQPGRVIAVSLAIIGGRL